jgi:hypothetical protein
MGFDKDRSARAAKLAEIPQKMLRRSKGSAVRGSVAVVQFIEDCGDFLRR